MFRKPIRLVMIAALAAVPLIQWGPATPPIAAAATASPIKHVVVIFQENHSFDNVLGPFCVGVASGSIVRQGLNQKCDGVDHAITMPGSPALTKMPDIVPGVQHSQSAQTTAVANGKMNGWLGVQGCGAAQCLSDVLPSQSPNLTALAEHFALSDRMFEDTKSPSWEGHLEIVAATVDGFKGTNPSYISGPGVPPRGKGWGCDSNMQARYGSPAGWVPSCVPDYSLSASRYPFGGAFAATPVPHVATILDLLDTAGLSWKLYAGLGPLVPNKIPDGYGWAICPSFAGCLYTRQAQNFVPDTNVLTDAAAGTLPAFSVVTPTSVQSQHNDQPWSNGDNWIGQVVSAIEHGPDWSSTAIFITWDDCGCFYDHVPPFKKGWGIRVPMVIVSPYARAGFTDSTPTGFAGVLAYAENNFGLAHLSASDASAYNFSNSFDYSQTPLGPVKMAVTPLSPATKTWLRLHPVTSNDPT